MQHKPLNRSRRTFQSLLTGWMLFMASIMLSGCGAPHAESERPVLTVSILPQKYFAEKISGNQFTIQVMIPPGQSPATYDPTPEQMINLSRSTIYFMIGHIEFEKTWIRDLTGDYPETRFIDTSEGIEFEHFEHEGRDHSHHGVEPHVWMSPLNVKLIARNMAASLSLIYPGNKDMYSENLAKFEEELDSLHQFISRELKDLDQREFIIYHPALSYYARDYGLVQIPIEDEGKEPSARYMKTLVDRAKSMNIRAVLVQQQFNQEEAKTLVREINGNLILIDPLDPGWSEQMKKITLALKSTLQKS